MLIVGPSGSGKSDLALQLVTMAFADQGRLLDVALVADDQVLIERDGPVLMARPPPVLKGSIEIRGYGIATLEVADSVAVHMIVDIAGDRPIARFPDPPEHRVILGCSLPIIRLDARHASAAARLVAVALRQPLD